MGVPHLDSGPMRAEEFFAFTATRPDDEKWELIEGEPVLNASASFLHQIIASNLIVSLGRFARETDAIWAVVPGIGVRISPMSVPVPDVLVRPQTATGVECDDMIIAFEILSPSTADYDLRWKRKAYASLPSLLQYVVIAQDAVEVVSFDRANEFSERRLETVESALDLPVIGACMNLRDIYRGTGLL
ncbi:Uma2 family endonuclease [Methylocystis suflitae]|uniref:Uma2 family endonuclease n=1 Tax=Methylocystis suflitae TaxID=2951405 RepID=UPI00210A047A|nr:Uma2 family endonuclease [Methylocystis suflitae]MCQ4190647.1 Uma2 family endonuclease [Methylocystis suflitae]